MGPAAHGREAALRFVVVLLQLALRPGHGQTVDELDLQCTYVPLPAGGTDLLEPPATCDASAELPCAPPLVPVGDTCRVSIDECLAVPQGSWCLIRCRTPEYSGEPVNVSCPVGIPGARFAQVLPWVSPSCNISLAGCSDPNPVPDGYERQNETWVCAPGFGGSVTASCVEVEVTDPFQPCEGNPYWHLEGCLPLRPCINFTVPDELVCSLNATDCRGIEQGESCNLTCIGPMYEGAPKTLNCPAGNTDPLQPLLGDLPNCVMRDEEVFCEELETPAGYKQEWQCAPGYAGNVDFRCCGGLKNMIGCEPLQPCSLPALDDCMYDLRECVDLMPGETCDVNCRRPAWSGAATEGRCPTGPNATRVQPLQIGRWPICQDECIDPTFHPGYEKDAVGEWQCSPGYGGTAIAACIERPQPDEDCNVLPPFTLSGCLPVDICAPYPGVPDEYRCMYEASDCNRQLNPGETCQIRCISPRYSGSGFLAYCPNDNTDRTAPPMIPSWPGCGLTCADPDPAELEAYDKAGEGAPWTCAEGYAGEVVSMCVDVNPDPDGCPGVLLSGCKPIQPCLPLPPFPEWVVAPRCYYNTTCPLAPRFLQAGESCEVQCNSPVYIGNTSTVRCPADNVNLTTVPAVDWPICEATCPDVYDPPFGYFKKPPITNTSDEYFQVHAEFCQSWNCRLWTCTHKEVVDIGECFDGSFLGMPDYRFLSCESGVLEVEMFASGSFCDATTQYGGTGHIFEVTKPNDHCWGSETLGGYLSWTCPDELVFDWECMEGFIGNASVVCLSEEEAYKGPSLWLLVGADITETEANGTNTSNITEDEDNTTLAVTTMAPWEVEVCPGHVYSGCKEIFPCEMPEVPDRCMLNASSCPSPLPAGEVCEVFCRPPYYEGNSTFFTCPLFNTDLIALAIGEFQNCTFVCTDPLEEPEGYTKDPLSGDWVCAPGFGGTVVTYCVGPESVSWDECPGKRFAGCVPAVPCQPIKYKPQYEPWKLRKRSMWCRNRNDTLIGEISNETSVRMCGLRCQHMYGCVGFAYKARTSCSGPEAGGYTGSCYLWNASCVNEPDECFDDYVMDPKESRCKFNMSDCTRALPAGTVCITSCIDPIYATLSFGQVSCPADNINPRTHPEVVWPECYLTCADPVEFPLGYIKHGWFYEGHLERYEWECAPGFGGYPIGHCEECLGPRVLGCVPVVPCAALFIPFELRCMMETDCPQPGRILNGTNETIPYVPLPAGGTCTVSCKGPQFSGPPKEAVCPDDNVDVNHVADYVMPTCLDTCEDGYLCCNRPDEHPGYLNNMGVWSCDAGLHGEVELECIYLETDTPPCSGMLDIDGCDLIVNCAPLVVPDYYFQCQFNISGCSNLTHGSTCVVSCNSPMYNGFAGTAICPVNNTNPNQMPQLVGGNWPNCTSICDEGVYEGLDGEPNYEYSVNFSWQCVEGSAGFPKCVHTVPPAAACPGHGLFGCETIYPCAPLTVPDPCSSDDAGDTRDALGANCSAYDRCDRYDTESFVSRYMCCACGGGVYDHAGICMDRVGVNDSQGQNCSVYHICGAADDADFFAAQQCCGCGGGMRWQAPQTSERFFVGEVLCNNNCSSARDGICENDLFCEHGTDCSDCGVFFERPLQHLAADGGAAMPPMLLDQCQGDCNWDRECAANMRCFPWFNESYKDAVPGCDGQGHASWDYCFSGSCKYDFSDCNPGILAGEHCRVRCREPTYMDVRGVPEDGESWFTWGSCPAENTDSSLSPTVLLPECVLVCVDPPVHEGYEKGGDGHWRCADGYTGNVIATCDQSTELCRSPIVQLHGCHEIVPCANMTALTPEEECIYDVSECLEIQGPEGFAAGDVCQIRCRLPQFDGFSNINITRAMCPEDNVDDTAGPVVELPECTQTCADPEVYPSGYDKNRRGDWVCAPYFEGIIVEFCSPNYTEAEGCPGIRLYGCEPITVVPCAPLQLSEEEACQYDVGNCTIGAGEYCEVFCNSPVYEPANPGAPDAMGQAYCAWDNQNRLQPPSIVFWPNCTLQCDSEPKHQPQVLPPAYEPIPGYVPGDGGIGNGWQCATGYAGDAQFLCLEEFSDVTGCAGPLLVGCALVVPCLPLDIPLVEQCMYDVTDCAQVDDGEHCVVHCNSSEYIGPTSNASCPLDNTDVNQTLIWTPQQCELADPPCEDLEEEPIGYIFVWVCDDGWDGKAFFNCSATPEDAGCPGIRYSGCNKLVPCAPLQAETGKHCHYNFSDCEAVPPGSWCEVHCAAPNYTGPSALAVCPFNNSDPVREPVVMRFVDGIVGESACLLGAVPLHLVACRAYAQNMGLSFRTVDIEAPEALYLPPSCSRRVSGGASEVVHNGHPVGAAAAGVQTVCDMSLAPEGLQWMDFQPLDEAPFTYDAGRALCESRGGRLALRSEYFPFHPSDDLLYPGGGDQEIGGERWAPVFDSYNDWVSTGIFGAQASGTLYTEAFWGYRPTWAEADGEGSTYGTRLLCRFDDTQARSIQSCSSLGWDPDAPQGSSPEVCGDFFGTCDSAGVTWAQAKAFCEALGARLCTRTELLLQGEAGGRCSSSIVAWSSTPCGLGSYFATASAPEDDEYCITEDIATSVRARCCADVQPVPPNADENLARMGVEGETCVVRHLCGDLPLLSSNLAGLDCIKGGRVILDPKTASSEECAEVGGYTSGQYDCGALHDFWTGLDPVTLANELSYRDQTECEFVYYWAPHCCENGLNRLLNFYVDPEPRSYANAKAFCASQGDEIASIRSTGEENQARALMLEQDLPRAYIGAEHNGNEWRWANGAAWVYSTSRFDGADLSVTEYVTGVRALISTQTVSWQVVGDADERQEGVLCRRKGKAMPTCTGICYEPNPELPPVGYVKYQGTWYCATGYTGEAILGCDPDCDAAHVYALAGCLEGAACAQPTLGCMYDPAGCRNVRPGRSCEVGCRPPFYFGDGAMLMHCPEGNLDPNQPLIPDDLLGDYPICNRNEFLCANPEPVPSGYELDVHGTWQCARGDVLYIGEALATCTLNIDRSCAPELALSGCFSTLGTEITTTSTSTSITLPTVPTTTTTSTTSSTTTPLSGVNCSNPHRFYPVDPIPCATVGPGQFCRASCLANGCVGGSEMYFTCPNDNDDSTRVPVIHSGSCTVLCEVCGIESFEPNLNVPAGTLEGQLTFGPTHLNGTIYELYVASYSIRFVDSCGQRIGSEIKYVPPVSAAGVRHTACCQANVYSTTITAESVPEGATDIQIAVRTVLDVLPGGRTVPLGTWQRPVNAGAHRCLRSPVAAARWTGAACWAMLVWYASMHHY